MDLQQDDLECDAWLVVMNLTRSFTYHINNAFSATHELHPAMVKSNWDR
jgi:hypothetical protein